MEALAGNQQREAQSGNQQIVMSRKRGRPRGSCKPPAPPAPVPWKIRVHLHGKFQEKPDGRIVYEQGITAYIHIRDRAKFDYVELCRAVMGRLTGPRKQGMMWYLNPQFGIPIGLIALQTDEDIESMWIASEVLDSNVSDVYTQDRGMVYNNYDLDIQKTYTIPSQIMGMAWFRKYKFEEVWLQLLENEAKDEELVAAGGMKNWSVSWSPETRHSTLRVGSSVYRVYYDLPFFYKLF